MIPLTIVGLGAGSLSFNPKRLPLNKECVENSIISGGRCISKVPYPAVPLPPIQTSPLSALVFSILNISLTWLRIELSSTATKPKNLTPGGIISSVKIFPFSAVPVNLFMAI
ncbi:hypothetical protein Saci_1894 [Sulfolobus acidocaldarius DSM 639]|uniref:Uncharacterized protein n=1 Tax=Sulfolobus acidocaldarius (strain ATCC 33909 / DSM 639 / JCM 8929 / NBRC 15157 / NCIMB 11770) TaxID=330779 RepID=Q4J7N4_SULAC|nr:hypothetical protein Saci_1894 [Sulfolobus acidocaldarius DSM 639]